MKNEVIQIDTDAELEKIIGQLHSLPDRLAAPGLLKNALNAAARKVRKQMLADVRERYAVSKAKILRDKSQGAPQVFTASPSDLSAAIRSRGQMQDLMAFAVRPNTRTEAAKGHVLASTSLKDLEINGLKAFLTTFASGHRAVVQRRSPDRRDIKKLQSPSVPHMLGNPAVLGHAEDTAYALLQAEIHKRVQQINLR